MNRHKAPNSLLTHASIETNIQAIDYIHERNIQGAIVECGVYKGGSMAAMLRRLVELGDTDRDVYLFDTFKGMVEPSKRDYKVGNEPEKTLQRFRKGNWHAASLLKVRKVIENTNYPSERVNYVVGDIRETLPIDTGPIALLRHDTDFYESTKAEMEHLHPLCVGVEIFDDYLVWAGSRKATLEYIDEKDLIKEGTIHLYYHDGE
jgi:hypothetical protein